MKTRNVIFSIILSIIVVACGGGGEKSIEEIITDGNLDEIRAKRAEIVGQQTAYSEQLKQLDNRISELDTNKKVPLITSFVIQEDTFIHYLELQGNVSTKNLLVVYPEYAGILNKVHVSEGEKVAEGQVLAKIDDGGLNQQLAQLEIQKDLAKTSFERQERLWKQKIGSEMQYLQSKSTYEAQEKAIKQLREQIEKTLVRAPFEGVIDEIITEEGNLVNPGMSPLIRIINLDDMYIETEVPERHIPNITKDKDVIVEFPILEKTIKAKIRHVGSYINSANRTFKIEVPLSNEDKTIKPNLTAKLKINDYFNEKAILIPQSIISENALGEQYVYVVSNKKRDSGVAQKRIIKTGKTQGDVIEVVTGIKNGDEIVKEGARSIKDGQEIKILN